MLVKSNNEVDHLDDLRETFDTLHKYKMKLNPMKFVFAASSGNYWDSWYPNESIKANLDRIRAIMKIKSPKMMKEE